MTDWSLPGHHAIASWRWPDFAIVEGQNRARSTALAATTKSVALKMGRRKNVDWSGLG